MEKTLCLLLAFMLIICGCSKSPKATDESKELLSEYLENIDKFETPIREFGEPTSYIDMSDDMVTGILYPLTEFNFLNTAIKAWVNDTAKFYKNETAQFQDKSEPSELAVAYESEQISDSYAYVKLSGVFASKSLAHPVEVLRTFNVDTKSKKILTASDIFTKSGYQDFFNEVVQTAEIDQNSVNNKVLAYFLLKSDGIEIILLRGDYLPMSDGTKTFFFPYADIKDWLKDDFSLKPQTEKKDEEPTETTDKKEPQPQNIQTPVTTPNVQSNQTGKKMIALTFDDGPSAHTDRLLDLFKKHGGKGTFFVLGNLIDRRPQTLVRMRDEGHQISSHGWDHRQLTKLDSQQIKDQLMMTRAKIFDTTGVDTLVMRPPYGSCNNTVKEVGKELGISFVNWSVDTLDWKTKNANSIYNEILKSANNGAIVLCHDLYGTTVDAMEKVIPKLIENGYELVTVNELMSQKGGLEAGKLYFRQ